MHPSLSYTGLARERCKAPLQGCRYREETVGAFRLHTLRLTPRAAEQIGSPPGNYMTLFFPPPWSATAQEWQALSHCLCDQLQTVMRHLLRRVPVHGRRILLLGLGNRQCGVDALGPLAAARVQATAQDPTCHGAGGTTVAVFCPGVPAQSGLKTTALCAGVAAQFRPHLVIALDALMAQDRAHLLQTVQISDAALFPGSGIGKAEEDLRREMFGCPFLSIGVPTALPYTGAEHGPLDVMHDRGDGLLITHTETDRAIRQLADLLGHTIDLALAPAAQKGDRAAQELS